MTARWRIHVFERGDVLLNEAFDAPLELGRQKDAVEPLYTAIGLTGRTRLAIAGRDEDSISRRHAVLDVAVAPGKIRIENLSRKVPVVLSDGRTIPPGEINEVELPIALHLGRKVVRVQELAEADEPPDLHALGEATVGPMGLLGGATRFMAPRIGLDAAGHVDPESMIRSLQAALGVLQSAATSWDFFVKAARALVEIVGLDAGRVLLRHEDRWRPEAIYKAGGGSEDPSWMPSGSVLARVVRERRTFWQGLSDLPADAEVASSLVGMLSIVVSPILDRAGEVIGVLYGDRRARPFQDHGEAISKLDAMLVDLLAGGVAAGLARLQQEQAALAMQVQFEQFFTPELAQELALHPELLAGQDREISVLFADIRGFSRVAERLGPTRTLEWIGDTLGTLSSCVLESNGVLVDYIGDELMAMWGAPRAQPDHAALACRAALAMLAQIPELDARWRSTLGEPMCVGIGVNSGLARVGNTGSRHKFKYGPLGNTVNLASRVQGATKYLKANPVITGATRAALGPEFHARRLGKVSVVNIAEPVDLFELHPDGGPSWQALRDSFESALREFESGHFRPAARLLGNLVTDYPDDGPSLVLIARAAGMLVQEPEHFDPAFRLPGK